MRDGRRRFVHAAWFGLTSVTLASSFLACQDESRSPAVTVTPDASSFEAPDSAAEAGANPDAARDAGSDAESDAGRDADAPVAVRADVTADFSTLANPNGAWTYGYSVGDPSAADAGALVVYSAVAEATPTTASWYDPANVTLGTPSAWRNNETATSNGVAPGEFSMHPGPAGEYAVARWTAPAAGVYAVTVQFRPGDTAETKGLLLKNGVPLVTESATSTDAVHDLDVTLALGDRLDAAVGSVGDYHFGNTPVRFTIRSAGSNP